MNFILIIVATWGVVGGGYPSVTTLEFPNAAACINAAEALAPMFYTPQMKCISQSTGMPIPMPDIK